MSPKTLHPRIPEVYGTLTDVGSVRGHNEDSFCAKAPLFVVADGMGGHEAGEVASEIAITTMLNMIPEGPDATALSEAVKAANRAVIKGAADGTGKPGMGTTMTAALVYDNQLIVAQVGDSRAYLLHDRHLQRITRDHSLVADLVAEGRITEQEARYHPQRSVITRALGSDPGMEPDLYTLSIEKGDRLLLCSDGLSSLVDDKVIEATLQSFDDPQKCCGALVAEALAAGGLDNVTTIVVDLLRETEAEKSEKRAVKASRERRKGRLAPLAWAFVFIVILAVAGIGFYAYAQNSFYLASNEDGIVCIYRGIPGSVFGMTSSTLEDENTGITTDDVPTTTAERLSEGIQVDSLETAYQRISEWKAANASDTDIQ